MSEATLGRLELDLSGIRVRLCGLLPDLAALFRTRWSRFLAARSAPPWIEVTARVEGRCAADGPFGATELAAALESESARFHMKEGEIRVDGRGVAALRLAAAPLDTQFHATINLLTAALAWLAPARGVLLVHAAGGVLDGRAFVLVGAAGSGKTTWAGLVKRAGALLLSDDVVFLDASGGEAQALATPIRGDHPEPHGPARWPVAALLFPRHGLPVALEACARLTAGGRVLANLPFIGGLPEQDRRAEQALAALLARTPCYELTFAPEPSFVDRLRALPRS